MPEALDTNGHEDDDETSSSSKTTGVKIGRELFGGASKDEKAEKAGKLTEKSIWAGLIGKDTDTKTEEKPALPKVETAPEAVEDKLTPLAEAPELQPGAASETKAEEPVAESAPEATVEKSEGDDSEEKLEADLGTMSEAEQAKEVVVVVDEVVPELETKLQHTEDEGEAVGLKAQIDYLKDQKRQAAEVPPDPIDVPVEPVEQPKPVAENTVEQLPEVPPAAEVQQPEPEVVPIEPQAGPAEFEHEQTIVLNAPEQPATTETVDTRDEAEPDPAQPATPPPGSQSQPNPNAPGGAGGNANQPPAPPVNPFAPGGPGNPGGTNGPNINVNFNTANFYGQNPNTPGTTRIENNYYRRESNAGFFFAGGLLGYMLGRRQGRIKTERLMRKVSNKLEKQIKNVREEVIRQSEVVREQARSQYNQTRQLQQRGAETTAARTLDTSRKAETLTELTGAQLQANRNQAAERLGINRAEAAMTAERVPHMDHREVLGIAERINVEGTPLNAIYEAKQITEPGLRRLTQEFLRGGDMKAALAREIQVKEMQYERDPQMRARLAASYAGVEAAQPRTSSDGMTALLAHGEPPKPAQMHLSVQQAAEEAAARKQRGKQVLVGAWAVIVFMLVIVALLLAAR